MIKYAINQNKHVMKYNAKDIIREEFALYFGATISEVNTVILDSKAVIQNPLMNLQTKRN